MVLPALPRMIPVPSASRMPREVTVLTAIAFSVAVGYGVVAPALPVFARDFGVGRTAAAAVISVFALMRLLSALPGGSLVDRFDERRVLATGIAIVAVSSALAGLSQSYLQLVLLRGAGGFGSALFSVGSRTLLLRSVSAEQRGRASGIYSGGFLLGGIAGPALGGFVTGISIRAPFFLYAGLLVVPSAIGLFALRGTSTAPVPDQAETSSVRVALRDRSYRAALAANLADGWTVLGVRNALLPLFVVDVLHRDPIWTGVGFVVVAAVNALTLLPAGRLADSTGRRPVIVAGCAGSAAGMLLLAALPTLLGYLVSMAVLGLGSGLLDVGPSAVVGDLVRGRGGRQVAAFGMAGDAGTVTGPVVSGTIADAAGYDWAFVAAACLLGGAAALAARAPETRDLPAQSSSA